MSSKNKKILNSFRVEEELLKRNILIFSPFQFKQIFKVSQKNASFFINYNVKKGFFVKLRNGFYAFKNHFPSEVEIANQIYSPSYLSLEYAMAYYNIIPDTVYSVTSITTKITREFVINGISYNYSKIKKSAFTGYVKKDINGETALIADPEKTFIDYLYFVSLGKKSIYDRIEIKNLKKEKLIYYAKLFKKNSLTNLLKDIYDKNRRNKEIIY
jgi:predicted transcriptional regulator of viral defense system